MLILMIILLKGARSINTNDLFASAADGGTSLTKFWQNVAYAAATIAFLAINISGSIAGASIEIIWFIYLAVIGSNAVLSKWLSLKYNRTEERKTDDEWFVSYPPKRRPRGHDAPSKVDNPDQDYPPLDDYPDQGI